MITCTLGGKKYSIPYVSGRALREIGPALDVYTKMLAVGLKVESGLDVTDEEANALSVKDALDTMIDWFCLLFQNQFTLDDVLDLYPADRLMHDLALTIQAVNNQATGVLADFPTMAAQAQRKEPTSQQS